MKSPWRTGCRRSRQPALAPLAFELLSFGVRGFKAGRQLEETIDQARLMLEQAAAASRPVNEARAILSPGTKTV